ncbi:hypothetical protein RHMOL_Rhmol08G0088200 [Rhododendron molle]|uniref:Uncharacterized protein n=1 Tax=Rhododendron molle TaxID=49168 RepID=A0ACC0MLK6_RHOML|nr:hypothetical protein RHMOL_Rhmol08G0088200 [Rhododendron molle]
MDDQELFITEMRSELSNAQSNDSSRAQHACCAQVRNRIPHLINGVPKSLIRQRGTCPYCMGQAMHVTCNRGKPVLLSHMKYW